MTIAFWILAGYFFVVFVLIRVVVPFMGFRRFVEPKFVPQEVVDVVNKLEQSSKSPKEYLEASYKYVTSNWYAGRMSTVLYTPLAFRTDLAKILASPGYAHCNTQNYLLFVLLVKSKYFTEEDVVQKCVFFNFFIHQYLLVKVGNEWVDVDPAGASIRDIPLGKHISLFG